MTNARGTTDAGSKKRTLAIGACVFALVAVALVAGLGIETVRADGRILSNVTIGTIPVGGLTPAEAEAKLREALQAVNTAGFDFSYNERTINVKAGEAGKDTHALITYDIQGMTKDAFAYGHAGGFMRLALANAQAMLSNVMLQPRVEVNREALRALLVSRFGETEAVRANADIAVQAIAGTAVPIDASSTPVVSYRYQVDVIPEKDGSSFAYDSAVDAAASAAAHWRAADIAMTLARDTAVITTENASQMRAAALTIVQRGELNLAYDDQKWPIRATMLAAALTLKTRQDGTTYVGLRASTLDKILADIAAQVETEAKPTKMRLLPNGKVDQESFVGGAIGKTLDRQATLDLLEARMADPTVTDVPVVIDTVLAHGSDAIAENLGVNELLGFGTSNFSGSPKNRRLNIANGARLLGGSVINPGEEFSLLNALKPFTEDNGYLNELVIKNNRTVPEVGGGLCQIGTTTFRATMASGLPVTQRQNHSYRVRYYEPAGTDATIYDPAPDYRFMNDTGHSIVVITKALPGDKLRFEFWGTRDGRVEQQGPVRIWNPVQPPDPKLIPTSELPDGKQKCFETAHAGATTEFTYSITYPDGHVEPKTFRSVYKPWQQQCLVGTADAPHIVIDKDGSLKELPPVPGGQAVTISTGIDQKP